MVVQLRLKIDRCCLENWVEGGKEGFRCLLKFGR